MHLTPAEQDRLLLFTAAQLARSRRARGLLLNVPETIAIVADTVCEVARDGGRHADALAAGLTAVGRDEVLSGVASVVREVRVEAVFDDGSRLVVVPEPVGPPEPGGPGSVTRDSAALSAPEGVRLTVVNTAPVAVSVSSHFHFFEVNPRLAFDRSAAYGRHLAVPVGTSVLFEPGVPVEVELVEIRGERVVVGFAGLVDGPLDAPGAYDSALERAGATGYLAADPTRSSE